MIDLDGRCRQHGGAVHACWKVAASSSALAMAETLLVRTHLTGNCTRDLTLQLLESAKPLLTCRSTLPTKGAERQSSFGRVPISRFGFMTNGESRSGETGPQRLFSPPVRGRLPRARCAPE